MRLKAIKAFSSPYGGNAIPGTILPDVPDHIARQFIDLGMCVALEAQDPPPFGVGGAAKPLPSSPAAPASDNPTLTDAVASEQLQSTAASSQPHGAMPSTPVTEGGGVDIPQMCVPKNGRKTLNLRKNTD